MRLDKTLNQLGQQSIIPLAGGQCLRLLASVLQVPNRPPNLGRRYSRRGAPTHAPAQFLRRKRCDGNTETDTERSVGNTWLLKGARLRLGIPL